MYVGWDSRGCGSAEFLRGGDAGTVTGGVSAGGCSETLSVGETRTPWPVGAGCGQFSVQHVRAATASGVFSAARAVSQQPGIAQPSSGGCIEKPASALPPSEAIRIKAVSHFAIVDRVR